MIYMKSAYEIDRMREAGQLLRQVFTLLENEVKAGVSTKKLDALVHDYIIKNHAIPSFLNYNGFPASICSSIDDVVVHGIPSEKAILQEGQIIGIDIGLVLNGYHSDCARTYAVGKISEEKKKLIKVTEECFFQGIAGIKADMRMGDISSQVQAHAEKHGYGVVTALTGHGIGKSMHEDPSVPNVGVAGKGIRLASGMTLAIEPMINMGTKDVEFLSDGWTCKTKDRLPSAHYENTVVITADGVEILTL